MTPGKRTRAARWRRDEAGQMMLASEGHGGATFGGAAWGPKVPPPARNAFARPPRKARRLRGDVAGQMMLLAAFIFVIGLLAMSATLARVPLLAKQVAREQDRPLVGHVDAMLDGLDDGLAALATDHGLTPGTAKFEAAVRGLLAHTRALEASHGFFLEWTMACDTPGTPSTVRAHIEITDGALWIEARTATFTLPACP